MATHDKVALRYARAILQSQTAKTIAKTIEELSSFQACLTQSAELNSVLTTNFFSEKDTRAITEDILARLKVSTETRKIILVLFEQRRMAALESIIAKLNHLVLESSGVMAVQVVAAAEMSDGERAKLEKKFQNILGKGVEATYRIDPKLIGGVKVTAGGKTYDGSVAGWLSTFEEQLVGGTI